VCSWGLSWRNTHTDYHVCMFSWALYSHLFCPYALSNVCFHGLFTGGTTHTLTFTRVCVCVCVCVFMGSFHLLVLSLTLLSLLYNTHTHTHTITKYIHVTPREDSERHVIFSCLRRRLALLLISHTHTNTHTLTVLLNTRSLQRQQGHVEF